MSGISSTMFDLYYSFLDGHINLVWHNGDRRIELPRRPGNYGAFIDHCSCEECRFLRQYGIFNE